MASHIRGWKITEEESLSYHKHIQFCLCVGADKYRRTGDERRVWKVDKEKVKEELRRTLGGRQPAEQPLTPEELVAGIKRAQDGGAHRGRGPKKVPYWWSQDIEDTRRACIETRRRVTRARHRTHPGEVEEEQLRAEENRLRDLRRNLAKLIRRTKRAAWKDLTRRLDEDIWGQGYKIATRHLKGLRAAYELTEEKREAIIEDLFPTREDTWLESPVEENPPPSYRQNLRPQ